MLFTAADKYLELLIYIFNTSNENYNDCAYTSLIVALFELELKILFNYYNPSAIF